MINFPDYDSRSPVFFGFLSSDTSICSTVAFPPMGNSDHVVVSPITFRQTQNGMPRSIA